MDKEKYKTKNSNNGWIFAIIIGIIIFLVIFIFASRNFQDFNLGNSSNPDTKKSCNDVQVPYLDVEEYIDQEPYQDIEYYNYYLKLEKVLAYTQEQLEPFGRGLYDEARVDLKNIDNIGEWVTVTFYWKTISKEWEETDRQFIEPGETIRFTSVYDKESGEDTTFSYTYQSDPIEKSKQVTKYRDVQKTRTVTKYKIEKVCE